MKRTARTTHPIQAQQGGIDFTRIDLPPHLYQSRFDGAYAQTLRLGPSLSLSIVPPRTMFSGEKADFGWARTSHSWLLILHSRLGNPRVQEIEVSGTSEDKLAFSVVRSSGRLVADGTATRTGDTFSFNLKIRCPPGTGEIGGSLSEAGRWTFTARR